MRQAGPRPYDNNPVSQAPQLSSELAQALLQLARALLGAVRNWTLYPPEHPSVATAVERLADAIPAISEEAADNTLEWVQTELHSRYHAKIAASSA